MTEEEKAVVEELKTGVQKFKICKVGRVGPVARSKEKADLVIYGRNGMRLQGDQVQLLFFIHF